jgi:nicotinate-nucleotide pyrophosphorylase (carboxylating)
MDDFDRYLDEDLDMVGDITSNSLFSDELLKAHIISKEKGIVAGLFEAREVFRKLGAELIFVKKDGDFVNENTIVAEINGPARSILTGERLALNFICKMSGIATETKKLIDLCKSKNSKIKIAATRKTTPGFRKYEKKAVLIAGGDPHRFGLYDEVMIKDNHLKLVGSVEKAIKKIKENVKDKIIEIEVENETDAIIAAKLDVDVIMLDNFTAKDAEIITKKIRNINPKIMIEISGNIDSKNIIEYASFADRISLGYLTHSIKSINFSLEVV